MTVRSDQPVESRGDGVKAALEAQWRERIEEISRLGVQLHASRHSASDADGSTGPALEQALIERQLDVARRAAADIEAALRRLDAGTYGVCDRCEQPVAKARLDALPHARLCAPCQGAAARE